MFAGPEDRSSDEQLMLAFAGGDAHAFEQLFRRYKQALVGFFRRRWQDAAVADELAQETWLAVVRSARHYQPSATFRTFLYAIALKQLRACRRKAAFRATFWGQSTLEPSALDPLDESVAIRQAVKKLDAIDREVVLLREFEDLSYAEIATLLKLPLNTVRSRLFRARMALRDLLQPHSQTGNRQKESV